MAATNFNVISDNDDGTIESDFNAVYPPLIATSVIQNSSLYAIKQLNGGSYFNAVGLIRWDTSSLPKHAVINSASLSLYVLFAQSEDSRNLIAEWYEPGTIGLEDYSSTVGNNALSGTAITTIVADRYNDFALQNLSNISKNGYTGLRFHISGGAPAGSNSVYSASYFTGEGNAILKVEYTLKGHPPVVGGRGAC